MPFHFNGGGLEALRMAATGTPKPKGIAVTQCHTYADIVTIHQAASGKHGGLYYDCDNDVYYFTKGDGTLVTYNGEEPPIDQSASGYSDFRFSGLTGLTYEATSGTTLGHDTSRGLYVENGSGGWATGVKFRGAFDFARSATPTVDLVFNTQAGTQIMLGFMRQAADVDALTTAGYYQQEAGIYIPGTFTTTAYGRNLSTGANAVENLGGNAGYTAGVNYRVRYFIGDPAGFSANLKIELVEQGDWDTVVSTLIDRTMAVVGGVEALCCPSFIYGAVGPFHLAGLRVA